MPASLPSALRPAEYPSRIVCLTDETTETLYLLGEQDRIAGVSGYSTRPPEARLKPRVSAFRNARFDAILDLKPDLVLAFSDVQAEITRELVLRGVTVLNFNQRSIEEILDMIAMLARIVGRQSEGLALIAELRSGLDKLAASAKAFKMRPRVYFEEWNDPLISGIRWVEELIEIAGGETVFPELRECGKAKDRVVDPAEVVARDPEVIIASWCGRKVNKAAICLRPGWESIAAVRSGHVYEVKSNCILQPGPAALTDGVQKLHAILARVAGADAETAPAATQIDAALLL
jgi:iron complex transport system substrate-binding protein